MTDRRRFLLGALAVAAGACAGGAGERTGPPTTTSTAPPGPTAPPTAPPPTADPVAPLDTEPVDVPAGFFAAGVASGDPAADGFVLWTRGFGDALPDRVPLVWEVSLDEGFGELVATGRVDAPAGDGHTAHVAVAGLAPATTYHYRFRAGGLTSPVGRSRTLPAAGSTPASFRLAVSSCQLFETGHYAAHRHLAAEDVDLVLWLGDFVYESMGPALDGRGHRGGVARDLAGYRDRYAQYRSDPDLRACQAAHPWVVTWDDHEVVNDYAGTTVGGVEPDGFARRRADAYRAWWENQPVRLGRPDGGSLAVHRRFDVGDLARLLVLDTRQHRDPQPCRGDELGGGLPVTGRCDGVAATSMLGADQRRWLLDQVASNTTRWTVLGQQVLFAGFDPGVGPAAILPDTWDGYAAERRLVAEALADAPGSVVLTGDLHTQMALDVRADPGDVGSAVVAAELMAPAISSPFPSSAAGLARLAARLAPHVAHFDPRNGYLVVTLTSERLTAEFRTLDDVTDPGSGISTTATATVDQARPGLVR